ncbi:polysaccharide pyruvyl transferase family protein [Butyrivibrio sp. NC2007]|uniref:polysaccharide pyruvyl transferase family protein n=1 Tax=Butyrivibrio sp. NC2007 TaxID=1280683 RepID=UPI0003B62512|nr:polysaccharide pyruvyl transferase family protein [Butyrivibrio sp. NC2007]
MKLAILTWVSGTSNYGSVLQAYALQEYLTALGFDVTVLNYKPVMDDVIYPPKYNLYYKKAVNKIDRLTHRNVTMKYVLKRTQLICDEFVSHNIELSKPVQGISGLKKAADEFDVFICGSDQIWSMNKKVNPAYYLEWVPDTKIKIAYAPSLPVHNLNKLKIDFLKQALVNFAGISVREEETATALTAIIDKQVQSVLDPTLLVDKKLWENLLIDGSADNDEPYILCYFLGKRDFYTKGIETIQKATGLSIKLIPTSLDSASFNLDIVENVGPTEFLRLIKNAEYVITDSYHATIFSVIFHREFFLFKRFDDGKKDTQNIRIYDLAKKLQISDRIIDSGTSQIWPIEKIDYVKVDESIAELQDKSRAFLANALPDVKLAAKEENYSTSVNSFDTVYTDNSKCSGCGACHDVCPVNAIEMQEDKTGYRYPVINPDICLKCGKCRRTCPLSNPVQNGYKPVTYIAATKEADKAYRSSSGGVFPVMCDKLLSEGGVIYGAEISKHKDGLFYVSHTCVDSPAEVGKLYNSKYIQSDTTGIYSDVKEKLNAGKRVLFSGVPCQVQGLKNFLGKDYPNLLTVEVICHGVPSHKIFHKYQQYLSRQIDGTLTSISFRDKTRGWDKNICVEYVDKSGITKKKIIPFYESSYFMMFLKGDTLRDSCLACPFASRKRAADITLGDYWGAEHEHPRFVKANGNKSLRRQGLSCVIINTDKGRSMFEQIRDQLVYEESTYEKVALHNKQLLFHLPTSKNRNKYLDMLSDQDYSVVDKDAVSRYGAASKKSYKMNNLAIMVRLLTTKKK